MRKRPKLGKEKYRVCVSGTGIHFYEDFGFLSRMGTFVMGECQFSGGHFSQHTCFQLWYFRGYITILRVTRNFLFTFTTAVTAGFTFSLFSGTIDAEERFGVCDVTGSRSSLVILD